MQLKEKDYKRFWSKVKRSDYENCWEWSGTRKASGYGQFGLDRKNYLTHRLAFMQYFDDDINALDPTSPMKSMSVCHTCDNKICVNPAHLFIGTIIDNTLDRAKKDRSYKPKGEKHPMVRLTEDDVKTIRIKYSKEKIKQKKLADEYNVDQSMISNIVNKKYWKHI